VEALTLTEAAQSSAKELLSNESEPKTGLRVAVMGGGCSGLQYKIGWDDPSEQDTITTHENGLILMVDQKSAAMLEGSVLEYHNTIEQQGFEVQNPQACGTCGCGKSFNT
jgi:iron-sulfur cluster assembly accessory protein